VRKERKKEWKKEWKKEKNDSGEKISTAIVQNKVYLGKPFPLVPGVIAIEFHHI